jgi:hypothetical protein
MNIPRSVWPRQVGYSLRAIDALKVLEAAIARVSEVRLPACVQLAVSELSLSSLLIQSFSPAQLNLEVMTPLNEL